tara:strand:+ start:22235 stop:22579 length:345 start_codon:yes stop_codon:yes gene_type:complete
MEYHDFIESSFTIINGWDYKVESWIIDRFEMIVSSRSQKSMIKFSVNQLLDNILWEIPLAVNQGFYEWKTSNLPLRLEAINFHRENCSGHNNCKMCKLEKQWSEFNERTRPELC